LSATEEQVRQLRRMVAETESLTGTYSDDDLASYIEARPVRDRSGHDPFARRADGRLTEMLSDDWTPTYDLAAAAADIWEEKAAALSEEVDASIDGASITRSQAYEHAAAQARRYRGRSRPGSIRLTMEPPPADAGELGDEQ